MIMPAGDATAQAICNDMPGDPMIAMAHALTARGLAVHITGCPDSGLLKATGTGQAACRVIVDDGCYVSCEYTPDRNQQRSPADTARVVARMLGTDYTSPRQYARLHQGVSPLGAVGRDMKARGMTVTLDVIADEETYSAFVTITIANPEHPERGTVHLEKDWVSWQCYGDQIAGGPAELAGTVADLLSQHPLTGRDRLTSGMPSVTSNHDGPTLAEVQAQFPAWQCAQGVSGMYYACHSATGRQVAGEDPLDLRDQIKTAEARRAATPPGAPGPLYQPGQL